MFVYDENKNPFIWNLLLSFNKITFFFKSYFLVLVILDNNEMERWKSLLVNLNIKDKTSWPYFGVKLSCVCLKQPLTILR